MYNEGSLQFSEVMIDMDEITDEHITVIMHGALTRTKAGSSMVVSVLDSWSNQIRAT